MSEHLDEVDLDYLAQREAEADGLALDGVHVLALSEYELLLHDREDLQGREHPATIALMERVAASHAALGQSRDARSVMREVVGIRRRRDGAAHLDTRAAKGHLAALRASRDQGMADATASEILWNCLRRERGADDPMTLTAAHDLARQLWVVDEEDRAADMLEETFGARRRVLGDDDPATWESLIAFLDAAHLVGSRGPRAGDLAEEFLLAARRTDGAPPDPDRMDAMVAVGTGLCSLGQWHPAKVVLESLLAGLDAPDAVPPRRSLRAEVLLELDRAEHIRVHGDSDAWDEDPPPDPTGRAG